MRIGEDASHPAHEKGGRRTMSEPFELKPLPISSESIPRALERALRYRLLNDPEQAESICLDILEVDPDNQEALVTLILALTDQFGVGDTHPASSHVGQYVARLTDEYQRHYYRGIVCERQARAYLRRPRGLAFAYEVFREAMDWFEKAAAIRPEGDDEALLRWNACVRTIRRKSLQPRSAEPELQLE
jgi:tetratricopeptide (TPR) repeat protein